MLQPALMSVSVAIVVMAVWYWGFLHFNRNCSLHILHWLKGAIAADGQISSVEWISPSRFRVRLLMPGSVFHQPLLDARLAPRQLPLKWAMWRWQGRQETLTFEANLGCAPRLSVDIERARFTGSTRRWVRGAGNWPTQTVASVFISTAPEWAPEISGCMSAVVSKHAFELMAVSFRSRAPHFAVTYSLKELLKHPSNEYTIFVGLRELAEGSPTSMM